MSDTTRSLNVLLEELESAYEWMCVEDMGKYFMIAWEKYLKAKGDAGNYASVGTSAEVVKVPEATSPARCEISDVDRAVAHLASLGNSKCDSQWCYMHPQEAAALIDRLNAEIAKRPKPVSGHWRTGCTYCGHDFDGHHEGCKWFKPPEQPDAWDHLKKADEMSGKEQREMFGQVISAPKRESGLLDPEMPSQELRLHMGELTAEEMRVARAAIAWANTRIEGQS